jgi:hypothetical protein
MLPSRRRHLLGRLNIDVSIPHPTLLLTRVMALQQLLFQRIADKEPAHLQSLESLRKIAHESHLVCAFQNTQRPRERQFPAQSNRASDLFID